MRAPGRVHRAVAGLLLVATTLTACTSWQVQNVSPEPMIATQHPSAVRVQRLDGSRVVLSGPRISADSLLGTTKDGPTGVPLTDINQIAVQHGDWLKTTGMVLGLAAIPFVVAGVAIAISCSDNPGCFD